jgi:hypothetical protein
MARSLDIETLIEDAFLAELPNYLDSGVNAIRWEDIKDKTLTPVVKVKATIVDDEFGTLNLFCGARVVVDFGIFTSKKIDENGKTANGIRGTVRNLINQDDIVDLLNAQNGLSVYNNGVRPLSSGDVPDEKIYHKSLTVQVVAQTEEPV